MRKLRTEIVINSSPEKIWHILTNFKEYPKWNPLMRRIKGKLKKNEYIEVSIPILFHLMILRAKVKILEYKKKKMLRWFGVFLIKELFSGEHEFRVEKLGKNKTKFIQTEIYRGILLPFFFIMIRRNKIGFNLMNKALKERVESR